MSRKEFTFRPSDIRLIATFRGLPKDAIDRPNEAPVALDNVLGNALNRLLRDQKRVDYLQFLDEHWSSWFAGTTAAQCKPERLTQRGCLWLKVPNAIVQQKLQFERELIQNTLNQILPTPVIKEIRYCL